MMKAHSPLCPLSAEFWTFPAPQRRSSQRCLNDFGFLKSARTTGISLLQPSCRLGRGDGKENQSALSPDRTAASILKLARMEFLEICLHEQAIDRSHGRRTSWRLSAKQTLRSIHGSWNFHLTHTHLLVCGPVTSKRASRFSQNAS